MRFTAAAYILGLTLGLIGYHWLTSPDRRRARTRLQRLQMRADIAALATAEMRRERDEAQLDATYWQAQYDGGVDAIIDRLRVAAADETPTRDRLVLEAMERQFENGGGS